MSRKWADNYQTIPAQPGWYLIGYCVKSNTVWRDPIIAWVVRIEIAKEDMENSLISATAVSASVGLSENDAQFRMCPDGRVYETEGEYWNNIEGFKDAMRKREAKKSQE